MFGNENIKYNVMLYFMIFMFYSNSLYTNFFDYIINTSMSIVIILNSLWLLINFLHKKNKKYITKPLVYSLAVYSQLIY